MRHPGIEWINPSSTAYEFFRSELYDKIDFVAWFLSSASAWLPDRIRAFLSSGLKKWGIWPWGENRELYKRKDYKGSQVTGALAKALDEAESFSNFKVTQSIKRDVEERLSFAAKVLELSESGAELSRRFFDSDWPESWFERDFAETHQVLKTSPRDFITPKWKDNFFIV